MSSRCFLLVVFSDRGHLNPALALAQELEASGEEVVLFSVQDDVSGAATAANLRARCFHAAPAALVGERAETQRSVRLAERLTNPAWLKRWVMSSLIAPVGQQARELEKVIEAVEPDVIVTDALAYAGAATAVKHGIKWATFSAGLFAHVTALGENPYTNAHRQLASKRQLAVETVGAPSVVFHETDVVSPALNLVFAFEALVVDLPERGASSTFVGPATPPRARGDEPAFAFERLPSDRPIVYISFGSHLSHPPAIYRAFVDALTADEAFFVISLKDLMGEPFVSELPAHVLAVPYAPQLQLLERASVMVNHGGLNSVTECLGRGKPMVVVPIAYDQAPIGKLVERRGLGVTIAPSEVSPARCRDAILPLLRDDAPQRAAAASFGSHAENGAARAAALLRARM